MRAVVRRVGARCAIGFEGETASGDVRALLRDFGVGAVLLRSRNVVAPEQVVELVRELQSVARDAGQERPLLVVAAPEDGASFGEPWTPWPPARALGRAGSEELARRLGVALAAELVACGVRMALTPVLDVDTTGREGPHADVELRPFRRACEAGVAAVMAANLLVRELDDEAPATLSSRVVGELLRKELGFAGLVVTADLGAPMLAKRWPPAESAVAAASAGCDLLCFEGDADAQVAGIEGLVRALESEQISFKEAEAAEGRMRDLKERYLLGYRDPDPRQARAVAGRGEHRALAEEIQAGGGRMLRA